MVIRLSQIMDQPTAVATLERALLSDRLHHAYLFDGPQGVGKQLTAKALALAINCSESKNACLDCINCRKIISGNHPDYRELLPKEGKRNILIDSIRDAEDWIRMRPHEGKAKVLVIVPADAMTESAANALLKTLEEPRPGNYILLVTAAASSLLPTVRSRCQLVRFRALKTDTVRFLLEKSGVDGEQAALLAALSRGSMEAARQYRAQEVDNRIEMVANLIEGASSRIPDKALNVAAMLRDRFEAVAVLELFLYVMEDLLKIRSGIAVQSALSLKFGQLMIKLQQGGTIQSASTHIAAIHRALTSIQRNNMNPQLAIEGMIMSMRNRSKDEFWSRIGAR